MGALQDIRESGVRSGRAHGADGVARAAWEAGDDWHREDGPTPGDWTIVADPKIHAVLRGCDRTIRVWRGVAGKREEFTIDEARELCRRGDAALMEADRASGPSTPLGMNGDARGFVELLFDMNDERSRVVGLPVARAWLVAFLAAVRGALRTFDAAERMASLDFARDERG